DLFGVPHGERDRHMEELYVFSRMEPFKKRRASALSGGMKQKLALSSALVHRPEILILDEPTFGVDPVSRAEFWDLLRSIRAGGTTIVVSTAYMDEADMCDRVALLFGGEIIAGGTPRELKAGYPYPLYRITGRDLHALRIFFDGAAGADSAGADSVMAHGAAGAAGSSDSLENPGAAGDGSALARGTQLFGDSLHVSFSGDPDAGLWETWRRESGDDLLAWERQEPGIEDVFLELIGDGRDANG
ncbi:MAG: ATP-binding cassette domain-containing protein, partial [Candidatus Krumholzibacteria bacterium]|nr:ATP-binding cassette domain-containing protein [Candidatus Krumholzibacteria bacterium]